MLKQRGAKSLLSILLQHNLVFSAPTQKEGDKGAVPLVVNPSVLLESFP